MIVATQVRTPVHIYHMRGLPSSTQTGERRTLMMVTERVARAPADRVSCVSWSPRQTALEHEYRTLLDAAGGT
jgi:hypothetical protein